MSDFVFANELNDEAFELARQRFVRDEAASWVQVQMQPVLRAVAGVCKMLGLKLDGETQKIQQDSAAFEQQARELLGQGAEQPDRFQRVLENRLQLLAHPTEDTLQRFFPDSYEDDVSDATRLLQSLDRSHLGQESLQVIAQTYEQHLQAMHQEFQQQTESPRWFIELSNDWDITYHQDGSVAQDPQLD